ncbi:MAG: HIT family protein [Promethearchaeota archaeon]|nr:MAG: HIT family protein [Candidatus Lokiarchaeota archaeon]
MSEDCLFCKITKGDIPSKKIFENEDTLAFLDINPMADGHTIVIPKNHYETLGDLPDEEINKLFQTVKKVAKQIYSNLNSDGYNIVMNNYSAAGQMIKHTHIHIIPRKQGDKLIKLEVPKEPAEEEELDKVLNKIKG